MSRFLTLGALCLALAIAPSAQAEEPVVRISGGSAFDMLPDWDGTSRLRVRNDVQLRVNFHPRWSLAGAGNLRMGRNIAAPTPDAQRVWAGQSIDEADLYRLALRYNARDLKITAGRFARPGMTGWHKVDGASVQVGHHSLPVGVEAWAGRVGHREPLTPLSTFGGGVEARITPPGAGGRWSGLAIRAGYSLYSSAPGIRHIGHANVSFRDGRGATISGGAAVGALAPATDAAVGTDLGVKGWFRARVRPISALTIGGGFRWEGLDPVGVPETTVGMFAALAPEGYAIADVVVGLRLKRLSLRVEGGPSIAPRADGSVRVGGTGRVSSHFAAADGGTLGVFLAGAIIEGSSYYGGGAAVGKSLKIFHLGGEVGVYQFTGINAEASLVAEGRLDARLKLPLPARIGRLGGGLQVVADVRGGANHLLAPWLRAGVGLRGTIAAWRAAP